MSQVVITQKILQDAVDLFVKANIPVHYNQAVEPWSTDSLKNAVQDTEGIVCLLTDKISAEVMDAAPKLKVIANVAVGYDNVDVAAATERGIAVTNTPDVLTETTADLAFALLLAIARRIPESDAYMRAGKYQRFEMFPSLLGVDVYGKTLGIVGMGRIGTAVARRAALGFNMSVLYTANHPKPNAEETYGAKYVSFSELLAQSDFISINTPLTKQTHHLFTLHEFKQMKSTACIINTARGPVVKESDLAHALKTGIIRGAAIDVFEKEPEIHPALVPLKEQLIVAPHVGSATIETRQKMAFMAVNNAIQAVQGNRPPNILNPDVWAENQ
ncbi:MAG: D-glycerate dehydrogenase [Chloroflexi bacterium]|nr:D-glycerate dehydrogenase [Chloroflexota bacterium]